MPPAVLVLAYLLPAYLRLAPTHGSYFITNLYSGESTNFLLLMDIEMCNMAPLINEPQ